MYKVLFRCVNFVLSEFFTCAQTYYSVRAHPYKLLPHHRRVDICQHFWLNMLFDWNLFLVQLVITKTY
jgi:hypothetical protein